LFTASNSLVTAGRRACEMHVPEWLGFGGGAGFIDGLRQS
jgi:hypothetical protein